VVMVFELKALHYQLRYAPSPFCFSCFSE
jgi:hypothetical protein